MRHHIVFASVIALFTLASSLAYADDCTWSPQGGTLHGTCKNQAGDPYCLACPASGGTCAKAPCPTPASSGSSGH